MKDRVFFDPPFRELLAQARLDTVSRVLACMGDRLAAWSRTSDTVFVRPPGSMCSVFVKRYYYPRWSQRVKGMLRGTFLMASRARSEFHALSLMRALGIQGVRPIAFGERRVAHFVQSCFLITEAVPNAIPLSTFIKTYSHRRGARRLVQARRDILISLARQVRHMHDAGFVHRDLFWRNVLIRLLPDAQFEFYFLDASVGRRIRMPQRRHDSIVRDIAAMGVLAPGFCSRADQMRFLLEYLQTERLSAEDRRWLRQVQSHSALLRDGELQRLDRAAVFDPPINMSTEAL